MSARTDEKIRCDACPVMCYIAEGRTGACDRYGNFGGRITRCDPVTILEHAAEESRQLADLRNDAKQTVED